MIEILKQLMAAYLTFWARLVLAERRPRIVGITGSVGKTTTKEAIAAVLMHPHARPLLGFVGKADNNLNSELGLPMAILRFGESPKTSVLGWLGLALIAPVRALLLMTIQAYPAVLVLEYAADRPGDIKRLVRLAPPEVAVITAVGPAHLEKFGTVDQIAKEKGCLAAAASPAGLVVLARDNSHVAAMTNRAQARVVKVPGRGVALAQAVARAVGAYFGLDARTMDDALGDFHSLHGRLQIEQVGSITVIDDTYNASPLSMELAFDTLAEVAHGGRTVAFLGEMKELGHDARRYHREVGHYAREKAQLVIGVGELAREYDANQWFATSREAAAVVHAIVRSGDLVLVKGSRSVAMERVVQALKELRGDY